MIHQPPHLNVYVLLLLLAALWGLPTGSAHAAVNGTATMDDVSFGHVAVVNGTPHVTASCQLITKCTNSNSYAIAVTVCLSVDGGQGHHALFNPGYMTAVGANKLYCNLDQPGHTTQLA